MFCFAFTFLLPCLAVGSVNYTARLSNNQLYVLNNVIINNTDGSCTPLRPSNDACQQYCKVIFNYNPNFLYNNARYFNTSTRLCQPMPICDLTIYIVYNSTTNTCFNLYYGTPEPSKSASLPSDYLTWPTYTFVCTHGKLTVDSFNNTRCMCDFGWESSWYSNGRLIGVCDTAIPIMRYLIPTNRPYYMITSDINRPMGADPSYYISTLKYYFRLGKYSFENYFQPYQLEVGTVFMARSPLLTSADYPYILLALVVVVVVFVLTVRYRCVQIWEEEVEKMEELNDEVAVGG